MTERGIPQNGDLYRHFKNKLYQVVTVAQHSETGEQLVIYQELYGDFRVYARPLAMFLSETDHEKYPEAAQKYRFEKVEKGAAETDSGANVTAQQEPASADAANGGVENGGAEYGQKAPGDVVNPKLMEFLDAGTMEEKYKILVSMRECMTDQMINNLAVVLDVVIPEGKLDDRYDALKICVRTKQRYESSHRLR